MTTLSERTNPLKGNKMSDYDFNSTVASYIDYVEHLAAHIEDQASITNYCDRELLATNDATAPQWVWAALTEDERDDIAEAVAEDGTSVETPIDTDPDNLVAWIDVVTEEWHGPVVWEHDGVYRYPHCGLAEEGALAEVPLSVEYLAGNYGEEGHICVTLTVGGPGVYLARDFEEDRMVVAWGSDKRVVYGAAVRNVLDYYAEYFGE